MGRINRLLMAARAIHEPPLAEPLCPLCGRAIPASQRDAHHLVPKSKGGRDTLYLHRMCHRQVHALLSETELARTYNTAEALLAHPEVARFVAWVKTKPNDFMERTRKHHSRR